MTEPKEFIKIADNHTHKMRIALNGLKFLWPLDAFAIAAMIKEVFALTDLLIPRSWKLQDLLANNIIDEFLVFVDEYNSNLSMTDKLNKLAWQEIVT